MKDEKEINELYNLILSNFIQKIRYDYNFTQKELAEIMNKSEITIRNYEKNRLKVTFEVLFFLIHYFALSPYYLHYFFLTNLKQIEKEKNIIFSDDEIIQVISLLYENLKKIYNVELLGLTELEKEKNKNKYLKNREIKASDFKENTLKIEKTLLLKHLYRYITTFYQIEYSNKMDFKMSLESKKIFNNSFFEKITNKIFYYINAISEYEFEENELNNIKEIKKTNRKNLFEFLNKY